MNNGKTMMERLASCFRKVAWLVAASCLFQSTASGAAENRYVVPSATNPVPPFTSWETAGDDLAEVVALANANDSGDTVWLEDGIYWLTNQVEVGNTAIRSASGNRENVIIDGNFPAYTNRCFYMTVDQSELVSLTIRNGSTITNDLYGMGAGIYMERGLVQDCIVERNYARYEINNYRGGGGIYMGRGTIRDSIISNNISHGIKELYRGAYHGGGGIFAANENNAIITNCLITANAASNGCAGGIYLRGKIYDSVISHNHSAPGNNSYGGGGMATFRAIDFFNTVIRDNTTTGRGGGVFITDSTNERMKMYNCLVFNNYAKGMGGGVFFYQAIGQDREQVQNCTIANNNASRGGGVDLSSIACSNTIVNSIICHNESRDYEEQNVHGTENNIHALVNCCVAPAPGAFIIPGAVSSDPQFVDPQSGNYRLRGNSPCINAGVNKDWMVFDLDGNPRIRYGRVDLGAYEVEYTGSLFLLR